MRRRAWFLVAVAGAAASAAAVWPTTRGWSLVARAADVQGPTRRIADLGRRPIRERDEHIVRRTGALRARVYEPAGGARRTVVAIPGLHAADVDERRMVRLARELAASGVAVVTPSIPELSDFAITPAVTDAITEAIAWAAVKTVSPDGRVGVIGISFSGGLAVVAAGRLEIRDNVAFVLSLGGHADLPRVLRYLCTGTMIPPATRPRGLPAEAPAPHDYGLAVLLLGLADRLVPDDEVPAIEDAVRRFLWASHVAQVNMPDAVREIERLRGAADSLPATSSALVRLMLDRDVVGLGSRLLPVLGDYGSEPALSPARSPAPAAPVFLLHGASDSVIPAFESAYLAEALADGPPVRLLVSPLITHADISAIRSPLAIAELASFAGRILQQ
jgi:dienelactone hydrolase